MESEILSLVIIYILLKVDMTLTKKDLLAAVKLCNNEPGAHATIPTR